MDVDVFVSYRRKSDRAAAFEIKKWLESSGWQVWLDTYSSRHGKPWRRSLDRALRCAKSVVVIWSTDAAESEWVEYEATIASKAGKLILYALDDTPLPDLPFVAAIQRDENYSKMKLLDSVRPLYEPFPDVVICAADSDRAIVDQLESELTAPEWTVGWYSTASDPTQMAADRARCLIVMWSAQFLNDSAMQVLALSAQREERLIQIVLHGATPPGELEDRHAFVWGGSGDAQQVVDAVAESLATPPRFGRQVALGGIFLLAVAIISLCLAYDDWLGSSSFLADFGLGYDRTELCGVENRKPFWWLEGVRTLCLVAAASLLIGRVFARETLWLFARWRPPRSIHFRVRLCRILLATVAIVVMARVVIHHTSDGPRELKAKAGVLALASAKGNAKYRVPSIVQNEASEYYYPYYAYLPYSLISYGVVAVAIALIVFTASVTDLKFLRRRHAIAMIQSGMPPYGPRETFQGSRYAEQYSFDLFRILRRYPIVLVLLSLILVIESIARITLSDKAVDLFKVAIVIFVAAGSGVVAIYVRYRMAIEKARSYLTKDMDGFTWKYGVHSFVSGLWNSRGDMLLLSAVLIAVALLLTEYELAERWFYCR